MNHILTTTLTLLLASRGGLPAADKDGNGLIAYPGTGNFGDRPKTDQRPANLWDCINFGREDAFANALAYRGATMFAELARQLQHDNDARFFREKAAQPHGHWCDVVEREPGEGRTIEATNPATVRPGTWMFIQAGWGGWCG